MSDLEDLTQDQGDDSAPDPEETTPVGTEDGEDVSGEALDSLDTETLPSLDDLPEDTRSVVQQILEQESRKRVGDAERGWTQKFQEQKQRLEEQARYEQIVKDFDRRIQEDPEGLLHDLQERVQVQSRTVPEDPGDPPDVMDYEAYTDWVAKDRDYRNHILQQAVQQQQQQLAPVMDLVKERQISRNLDQTAQKLGVPVEEVRGAYTLLEEMKSDPEKAWGNFVELYRLKAKQTTQRKNLGGVEDRPGPSRTSVRRPVPKPSGDLQVDIAEELDAEGYKYPDD